MGDVGDHLRHQPGLGPDALRSAGARIACSSSSGVSGGTASVRAASSSPNRGYSERPVVEVRTERHDHAQSALGIGGRDAQRLEEQLSLALVVASVKSSSNWSTTSTTSESSGATRSTASSSPGSPIEQVVQPGDRTHGDSKQGSRQFLDRVGSREHLGDGRSLRRRQSSLTDRGHQPGAHHR